MVFTFKGWGFLSPVLMFAGAVGGLVVGVQAGLGPSLNVPGILLGVAGGLVVVAGVTYPLGVALNTERTPRGPVRHDRNTVDSLPMQDW